MKKMSMGGSTDGMDTDGSSKNTFGPKPATTPNKVAANDWAAKNGKGQITGGIEDESIFGSINYTGNTANAETIIGAADTIDMSIFNKVDKFYSTTTEGFPQEGRPTGVFGTPEFAASMKNAKVNGSTINDENMGKPAAKPMNKKRHIKPEAKFNGKNPTSLNTTATKNILSKGK